MYIDPLDLFIAAYEGIALATLRPRLPGNQRRSFLWHPEGSQGVYLCTAFFDPDSPSDDADEVLMNTWCLFNPDNRSSSHLPEQGALEQACIAFDISRAHAYLLWVAAHPGRASKLPPFGIYSSITEEDVLEGRADSKVNYAHILHLYPSIRE